MYYIYYGALAILAITCLIGKGKQLIPVSLVSLLMIWLYYSSTNIPDYSAYYAFYEGLSSRNMIYINGTDSSILFSAITLLFKYLGFSFKLYRAAIFVLFGGSVILVYRKEIQSSVVLLIYGFILFFFDLVQIRFFCAGCLVLCSLYYLLHQKKIKFLLLVGLATLFHSMLLLFALAILIPQDRQFERKSIRRFLVIVLILAAILLFSTPIISALQNVVSLIPSLSEYGRYMRTTVKNGYLLYLGYQFINVLIAYYLCKMYSKDYCDRWHEQFGLFNMNLQIGGLSLVLLTMININFGRYIRMLFMINTIVLGSCVFSNKQRYVRGENSRINRNGFFVVADKYRLVNSLAVILFIGLWLFGETNVNNSLTHIINGTFGR